MNTSFICFGEVLWDNLPDGAVAGGAPMNVAVHLTALGHSSGIISAVGTDEKGEQLQQFLHTRGVDTALIQKHISLPTGEVNVSIDADGLPSYDIVSPSAWDEIIAVDDAVTAVRNVDAFIFGSLSCRSNASKESLFRLLEVKRYAAFDVNLRAPYISIPLIDELMQHSDLIKMNDEELRMICGVSESEDMKEHIRSLSKRTGAEVICVTRGKDGAMVYADEVFFEHPGYRVSVTDTVGAGDSFLAGFISSISGGKSIPLSLEFACTLGALTATRKGANPEFSHVEIQKFSARQIR